MEKQIVNELTRLLKLGEKALSKKKIHSVCRIEMLLSNRIKKLQQNNFDQKALSKEDIKMLAATWQQTKDLIENIGQFCENFFYESQKQNYNSLGEKTNERIQYLHYSLQI